MESSGWGRAPGGWGRTRPCGDARIRKGQVTVREILVGGIESGEFLPADPDLLAPTVSAILQVQLAGLLDRFPPGLESCA
jgi:hypothetical protein